MPINTDQCGNSSGHSSMSTEVCPPGEVSSKFQIIKVKTQASLLGERLESLDKNLNSCGLPPRPELEAAGTT